MDALASLTGPPRTQRGYTLVEIMVALLIAVFLIGGILTVVQDNRRTFGNQNLLAQLQDQERLAMTMMTSVIESAGYYPDPTTYTIGGEFPAVGATADAPAFAAGQAVAGSDATPNSISVRFATLSGDNILRCNGTQNTSGAVGTFVNTFSVQPDPNNNNVSTLFCNMNGTPYALVSGVTNLVVLYGVHRSATAGNSVDTYISASQLNFPTDTILSVKVILTFNNPLYVAGQAQPASITFTRVIGVMGAGGIVTAS